MDRNLWMDAVFLTLVSVGLAVAVVRGVRKRGRRSSQFPPGTAALYDLDSRELASRLERDEFCAHDSPELRAALQELLAKCRQLRGAGLDFSRGAIPANRWLDGYSLVGLARATAWRLRNANLPELELEAWEAAGSAVCSVLGHYDHEVAPTMLELGSACEATGRYDRAQGVFRAIVGDYARVTDEIEGRALTPAEVATLTALVGAVERLKTPSSEDEAVLARARGLLARAADDGRASPIISEP